MKETTKHQRVVTFLNRNEVDFLDRLGKDALFSTGTKLSRAKLIAWLIDLAQSLQLNGEGIKNVKDFERKFLNSVTQTLKKTPQPATEENNDSQRRQII